MSFIPEDEIKGRSQLNLAPMIDFLFLMMMFFACLAVSRVSTKDTDIELVEVKPETHITLTGLESEYKVINININAKGEYKWVTDIRDYHMQTPEDIAHELITQYQKGLLPEDKLKTQVFLKIDKQTAWDPILKAILAIREAGFEVRPVYQPEIDISEKNEA